MENAEVEALLHDIKGALDALGVVRLGRVAEDRDIQAFEQRHHVLLPVGYRRFLLEIGNGGDGPGCGLEALDFRTDIPHVSDAFPLDGAWRWDDDPAPDPDRVAACQRGWIRLGTEGCGIDLVLVVSGSQRGNVWSVEDQGAQPCAPGRDFLSWYLIWLKWMKAGGSESGTAWWDVVWAEYD